MANLPALNAEHGDVRSERHVNVLKEYESRPTRLLDTASMNANMCAYLNTHTAVATRKLAKV
jgi:hypothetical protein